MRIGTWRKTLENEKGDYFVYKNSKGYTVKIALMGTGSPSKQQWLWNVEFRNEKKMLYLGGIDVSSKETAFTKARAFMRKHGR